MGLERHIYDVLDEKKVPRSKYYFNFGLKTDTKADAVMIAEILNDSGEFGPAEVFWQSGLDTWGIRFGMWIRKEE